MQHINWARTTNSWAARVHSSGNTCRLISQACLLFAEPVFSCVPDFLPQVFGKKFNQFSLNFGFSNTIKPAQASIRLRPKSRTFMT